MLDSRQTDGRIDTHGAARVRAALNDGRDAARTRLTETLDAHKVSRWLQDVKAFEEELADPQTDAGWRVVLARRLLKRTDRLRAAVNEAGVLFVSERLHAVRVAVKRLRYAVELAAELGGRKLESTVNELKAGQDALGELHDVDVLMSYVSGALDGENDPHVRASLEALQTTLEAERHELHARYLTHQPSLLVLIDRIQDQIVPRFTMARATTARPATSTMARRKPTSRAAVS
jgi:CHAD domain-containing protein